MASRVCVPHRRAHSPSSTEVGAPPSAPLAFLDIDGWVVPDPDVHLYEAMINVSPRALDKAGLAALLRELSSPDPDE